MAKESASDTLSTTWRARETARVELARLRVDDDANVEPAIIRALSICATALHVERVGVWFLDDAREYLASTLMLDHGEVLRIPQILRARDIGRYEDTLRERRVVAASDVHTHPLMADLAAQYFDPLGITSSLDAPIYRNGRVIGIVCHEHRGEARAWTETDAAFAVSMAEVIASLLAASELAAAESKLREQESALAAIEHEHALATVASGVAHDVNNMLAVVTTAVGVLRRHADAPARVQWAAERIEAAADSASALCAQLLLYGGEAQRTAGRAEIDPALSRIAALLASVAGEDRIFEIALGAEGKSVALDAIELERIATNLVANARDATLSGGRITLRTAHDHVEGDVVLSISDDGHGLDPALLARIFEPYFSTKADGGRGLGLATVQALARAAGGSVGVTSVTGRGATFTVRLPAL